MEYKILIADDEKEIIDLLKLYLEKEGIKVISAYDGEEALNIISFENIDLVILDIMMPKLNGFEVTKQIREKNNVPIMILSAKQLDSDKILGIDLGADDYISKPFNPLEVVARVKSQLRRNYKFNRNIELSTNELIIGDLKLDEDTFELIINEKKILLTSTEYKILRLLMNSPGRVFTKEQIVETIRGEYFYGDENSLMVHISNLRDKVENDPKNPQYIKTIRGIGYKIEKR